LLALIAKNLGYKTLLADGDLELAKSRSAEIGIKVAAIPTGSLDDSYPTVVEAMRSGNPPRSEAGLTIFFTGLSGSGKSTIANILRVRLMERGGRSVSLLDGDLVRKSLSSELTFSKEHRNINILRIGYVASEITKHGGLAICAPIAPYDGIRKQVRENISANGGFVLIHVATPLEACEARDRKGLYAMARAGKIKEFTGISDPYEEPEDAELVIQTTEMSADEACDKVIAYLEAEGHLPSVKF
jgi:sulfate adenylyltransferase